MLRGFDVSHHQGPINWVALEGAYGIDLAACKATEGTTFRDDLFPDNWAKLADLAMDVDIVRMAYHFGHPAKDPRQSVDVFLDYVGDVHPTDLLVLDLETGDGLSQATVNEWAKTWADHLRGLVPSHSPVLYCGRAYMENDTGVGLRGPYGSWWYPRYPNGFVGQAVWPTTFTPTLPSPNAWGGLPQFWQFSSTFPSIEGPLDADVFDGTLDDLRSLNQETSMALTPADVQLILDAQIPNRSLPKKPDGTWQTISVQDALSYVHLRTKNAEALLGEIKTAVAAIPDVDLEPVNAKLDALMPLLGLLPGQ